MSCLREFEIKSSVWKILDEKAHLKAFGRKKAIVKLLDEKALLVIPSISRCYFLLKKTEQIIL